MSNRFFVVVLALSMASCSDGRGPTLDTGVDEGARVNELGAEELARACAATQEFLLDLVDPMVLRETACAALGAIAAAVGGGVEACEDAMQQCVQELGNEPAETPDLMCDTITPATVASCNATVGRIEHCANVAGEAVRFLDTYAKCSVVADPEAFADAQEELDAIVQRGQAACDGLQEIGCLSFEFLFDALGGDSAEASP